MLLMSEMGSCSGLLVACMPAVHFETEVLMVCGRFATLGCACQVPLHCFGAFCGLRCVSLQSDGALQGKMHAVVWIAQQSQAAGSDRFRVRQDSSAELAQHHAPGVVWTALSTGFSCCS